MSEQTTRRFPRFLSQRSIPNDVKAAIAKLGADPHGSGHQRTNMRLPDGRVLAQVANTTIGNIQDARNLFQVLPDMDYARQVLISATISPGDLTDSKVLYSIKDDSLDTNLTGPLLRQVQEFFDNSYRIRTLLHPILNDVMFETGSYPVLIMPESSIDRIINGENYAGVSMESAIGVLDNHLREETDGQGNYLPWGILGNPVTDPKKTDSYTGVSFESMHFDRGNVYNRGVDVSNFKISLESMVPNTEENKVAHTKLAEMSKAIQSKIIEKGKTIEVIDNLNILKRPMVVETRRKIAVRRIYGGRLHQRASLESRAQSGDLDAKRNLNAVEKSLYSKRRYAHVPVQPVMTHAQTGTETYGHPLVIHLPSESVIPIHVPGNPSEHVGYYVMLDIDGNPINVASQSSYYDDIKSQMNNVDGYASQIISQARRGFEGMGGLNNEIIDEMGKIHSDAVEADLLARLRSGALSGHYELGKTENINRIMLARHLKGQKTMMLFVPPELMTYIAFDYNEYGVGKSVLEDGKILGSIRASLMLANTLATINNAVGGKTIEIELDPDDENPVETVEFMLSEHAKVNSQGFSRIVGSTHPLGLADQIQNHGVNVVVSGNSRYPETKFNVGQRDGTSKPVDTDLEEMMRKRHIQMFGLSPELMEGINQTDFATTVVQNNLMLLKRVIQNQEKFEPFLTDIIRRYILNSGIFLTEMRALVQENSKFLPEDIRTAADFSEAEKIDTFLFQFIEALHAGLPSPEIGDIKKSMEDFEAYSDALDKVIDAYMNEEMFATDTALGMEEIIPNIKAVVKAEFQRRWLRNNNVLPELDVFTTVNEEDGSPAFDLLETAGDHLDGLNNALSDYIKKVVRAAKKRAKVLEKVAQGKQELEEAKNAAGGVADDSSLPDDGGELDTTDTEADPFAEAAGDDLDNPDAEPGDAEGDGLDDFGGEVEGADAPADDAEAVEGDVEAAEGTDAGETADVTTDAEDTFDIASVDDDAAAEPDVEAEPDAEAPKDDTAEEPDAEGPPPTEPSIDLADIPLDDDEPQVDAEPATAEPEPADVEIPAEAEIDVEEEEVPDAEVEVEEPEVEAEAAEEEVAEVELDAPEEAVTEEPEVEEPVSEVEEPDVNAEEEVVEEEAEVEEEETPATEEEPETDAPVEEEEEKAPEEGDKEVTAAEKEAAKQKKEIEDAHDDLELPDIDLPKL